jgi:hypothetical protein
MAYEAMFATQFHTCKVDFVIFLYDLVISDYLINTIMIL